MAKSKGKRRPSTGAANAPTGNATNSANNTADSLPDMSAGVLANLTKKIEQNLQGNDKTKSAAPKKTKPKATTESQPPAKVSNNKGKKRDRSGKVIPPSTNATRTQDSKGTKAAEVDDVLEKEIYAFGGTREDYDLLAGVDSGSEVELNDDGASKGGKNDADLRNDIAKLLGGGNAPSSVPRREKADTAPAKAPAPAKMKEAPPKEQKQSKDVKKNQGEKKQQKEKVQSTNETSERKETTMSSKPSKTGLEIEPRPDWYATPLPELPGLEKRNITIARHIMDRIREYARSLLEAENQTFANTQQSSSSSTYKFYSTIVTSGTLSDKISALTLAVQESPLHNTKGLDTLIGLAKKRSRAQAVEVLRSLKDLFAQGTLLPSDRRLKSLANQPALLAAFEKISPKWTSADGLPEGLERSHLIMWAFEDFLKEQYFEILKILEVWCNDEIEFSRSRAVSYVYELLKEKPEQESNLLRLLVNKLGDPSKKIASRASYLLLQLEQAHPMMKSTMISAVESELLFRPGQSKHAQYYGVITLNQTILSAAEEKVAAQLLDIYFSLFVSLLKSPKDAARVKGKHKQKGKKQRQRRDSISGQAQDEELREKLISAVLTGVNRAYPFTTSNTERLSNHIETLFRITHSSNFNTSIQALMLIQQLSSSHQVSSDRFYRTLYESLLDPRIAASSKQSMYLNLLYKALKADLNMKRVKAFIKRLVQILGLHQASFICGVFYLIRELETTYPSLTSLVDQPEDHESDDEEVFRDVPDEDDEAPAQPAVQEQQSTRKNVYDSRKRDPEQANADNSCLWELLPYLSHFHPSVAVAAEQLLLHQKMSGKPDLTIHTLSHFLDRFVYRSPKAAPSLRGSSIMQPLAAGDTSGLLVTSGRTTKAQEPVNSEAFWKKKAEDVAAEDAFFHAYFNRLGKDKLRAAKDKKKKKKGKEEDESGDESEAESEIWRALVESKPEVDGGLDSDGEDFDMEDFEEAMGEDEDMGIGEEEDGFEGMDVDEMESGSDGGVIFNDESDEEEESADEKGVAAVAKKAGKEEDEWEDEESFDFDASDEEAFRDSDEDLPSDLEVAEEEIEDEGTSVATKKKNSKREKRRKLKHLPTFASMDDYAALLAKEDSGNEM